MNNKTKESKIEKETFWQKINPYYGSLKYAKENEGTLRGGLEYVSLAFAPGGSLYIAKKDLEEGLLGDALPVFMWIEIFKGIVGYAISKDNPLF